MAARPQPRHLAAALIVLAAGAGGLTAAPLGAPSGLALALVILAIGLWASAAIPEHVTALVFFALAMLLAAAPPNVVFSGFYAAATWLVFGGLVIGVAVNQTGLGARIANRLAGLFGRRYAGVIFGMIAVGVALAFLMPSSMGRVLLLMPIAFGIADRLGFASGTRGRSAIVLATCAGAFLVPFGILPANVPNIVLLGLGEDYGFTPTYAYWLLLHFPVLGLLKGVVAGLCLLALFPDEPRPPQEIPLRRAFTKAESRLSLILALALAGWLTDFAHGISPAWIALAAAVACLLPGIGVLGGQDFAKVNFASVVYVAGILGVGALIASSGWGIWLGEALIAVAPLEPGAPFADFLALAGIGLGVGLFTTLPGVPAVMTPLAPALAQATGLPLDAVLMLQVVGFSTPLFAYQGPPIAVAVALGWVTLGDATRLLLAVAAATLLVLYPLDYLWWRLLGVI